MMRYILYALLVWFLYNLVFRFIIPVYKTSKQMRRKFREMQQQMHERTQPQEGFTPNSASTSPATKPAGDYIDFEEIK